MFHSHLQDSLQLLQFRFLLLDLTVIVLAQFNQQQAGDVQHFLETQAGILNLTLICDTLEKCFINNDTVTG